MITNIGLSTQHAMFVVFILKGRSSNQLMKYFKNANFGMF